MLVSKRNNIIFFKNKRLISICTLHVEPFMKPRAGLQDPRRLLLRGRQVLPTGMDSPSNNTLVVMRTVETKYTVCSTGSFSRNRERGNEFFKSQSGKALLCFFFLLVKI